MATTKKQTAAEIKSAAAQAKADEVAALMGDDTETSAVKAPTAPPAIEATTVKAEAEKTEIQGGTESEDQVGYESDIQGSTESEDQGSDESEDQNADLNQESVGHLVILSRTIHTKGKAGNDVKFIASKEPQDLGEYGEMAIKAGFAKLVTE